MTTFTKIAAFAGTVLFAGAAFAQETTEDPAAGLDLGTPVNEAPTEPQPGDNYLAGSFGDWTMRCLKAAEGPDPCEMVQRLSGPEGNAVAEIGIVRLPDGNQVQAGAVIAVPLDTLLSENLRISVDGSNPRSYNYTRCNAGGCIARVGFRPEEVAQFKRGNVASLRVVSGGGEEFELPMSLTGFTAAFDALAGN